MQISEAQAIAITQNERLLYREEVKAKKAARGGARS
jgi:hypothetical protein